MSKNIINALLLGYLFVLINAYLVNFHLLEPNTLSLMRRGGGFLVIFAYLVFQKVFQDKEHRFLWGGFFLVICYDIFFILNTRTGWLIFIGLTLLFLVQHFSIKRQLVFLALFVFFATGLFYTSQSFQQRIQLTIQNLKNYNAEEKNSRTALGLRLDWYQNSIALIKEKPIFGYGTGSYEIAQKKLIEGTSTEPATDPHNEFLLTTVQIGLVGSLILSLLFLDPIVRSFKLLLRQESEQAFALQATVTFLFIGCLFNSWLLSSIPSHIFAFLIVAFYPIREIQKENNYST